MFSKGKHMFYHERQNQKYVKMIKKKVEAKTETQKSQKMKKMNYKYQISYLMFS